METNKIITDELIENKLREINVFENNGDLNFDDMLNAIQKHYDFTITDDWPNRPDMMFYTETTTDGYEIWIATDSERNPSISEDVYYYDNDWLEKMPDAMIEGCTIYYDQLNDHSYAFEEAVEEVYNDYYNDKKQDIENELIEEGYEYETEAISA